MSEQAHASLRPWRPNRSDIEWIFWGVLALGLTLPSAMLAWVDQPPPDEE